MNKETIKTENVEDGTDLYDGMIFKAIEGGEYISTLDYFTLHKLKARLTEYYEIMNDEDYTKVEKLSEKLGFFIDKYKFKSILDHVIFLLNKENKNMDDFDVTIVSFIDKLEVLEVLDYDHLMMLRKRLLEYYSILKSDDEELKEKFFETIGHNLATDSVKGMLDYVEVLIEEKFEQGQ